MTTRRLFLRAMVGAAVAAPALSKLIAGVSSEKHSRISDKNKVGLRAWIAANPPPLSMPFDDAELNRILQDVYRCNRRCRYTAWRIPIG